MTTKVVRIEWADGEINDHMTMVEAYDRIRGRYPGSVMYDAGGFIVEREGLDDIDIRSGRAWLAWENEEEAQDDDGGNAVAEVLVEEEVE